eukprot:COSAG06_NODE_22334_length_726_cov_15.159490_1_plen_136_part_00
MPRFSYENLNLVAAFLATPDRHVSVWGGAYLATCPYLLSDLKCQAGTKHKFPMTICLSELAPLGAAGLSRPDIVAAALSYLYNRTEEPDGRLIFSRLDGKGEPIPNVSIQSPPIDSKPTHPCMHGASYISGVSYA